MRSAQIDPDGTTVRWVELPGAAPPRVYLHGLGASSAPYYTPAATHPALAGHRSLLVDLLGFGISDRPDGFDYSLGGHADALAAALTQAGVDGADVVAHSMGGAVAIVLAERHPHLVERLVLVDANLDRSVPGAASSAIAGYTETDFLTQGWDETLDRVGPHWRSTMRLAAPLAVYRSAVSLARGSAPTPRETLQNLPIPRTFVYPAVEGPPAGAAELTAAGVRLIAVADSGHNVMLDNVDGFARAVAGALMPGSSRRPGAMSPRPLGAGETHADD